MRESGLRTNGIRLLVCVQEHEAKTVFCLVQEPPNA